MKRIFHYSLSVILLVFLTTSISYAQTCITITQPSDLTLSTTNTNVSCFGTSTGQIVASGAGGTTAYTYSINGGAYVASGTFPNLAMGTYAISLKDANGCTKSASVTLTEPTALMGTIAATETSCTANDNKVLANASVGFTTTTSGGTTPYTYAWSNSLGSASTATATVAATTTYNVTITDNKGCSVVPTKLETVIAAPTVAIVATESSCTADDQKLLAGTVATLTAGASGGTAAYTYLWSTAAATAAISPTVAATTTYSVTATDANGCTAATSQTETVITAPTVAIVAIESSCTANDQKLLAGTVATLTAGASGGTAAYTYLWSTAAATAAISPTVAATTTYSVTATDANGCTAATSQTETVITAPTVAIVATESSCTANDQKLLAGTVATLTAGASGGTAGYTYLWSTAEATAAISPTVAATTTYSVIATDANGCTAATSQTETVITAPTVAIVATESSCTADDDKVLNGATVNLTAAASGGTPAYTYDWNNTLGSGATKAPTVSATTTYIVTATDANGCTATANKTIIGAPALTFTATQINVKCFGGNDGSFEMTGAGGTAPYEYSKDDAATFQPSNQFLSLPATTYKIAIKDVNGCVTKCL